MRYANETKKLATLSVVIMEQSIGIILSHLFSRTGKIALLDKQYGRIDGIVHSNRIVIGALVRYTMRPKHAVYIIDDINIHEMPLQLARQDILFLHHVLELCYQLIPVNSSVDGIFDLLLRLYSSHTYQSSAQYKKLFLFKLLTILGIYSCSQKMSKSTFDRLMDMPIDSMCDETLDLGSEKELDIWLYYCITEHVRMDALRTIHFLSKSRVL